MRKLSFSARKALTLFIIFCCASGFGQANEIARLFEQKQSDVFVEGKGRVINVLLDDNDGARHQRFILKLNNDMTVLVAHNIDLAPRINGIQVDDIVEFRGEYVWNNLGGLIHWTHNDPKQTIKGGWLRHKGKQYD